MKKHVCVIGIDSFNLANLRSFETSSNFEYHSILDVEDIQGRESYPMQQLREKAHIAVDNLGVKPDAIVGFWNFPVTALTPILAKDYGLPHLPLNAFVLSQHKYLSRKAQVEVIPEYIPDFCLVDPFKENSFADVALDFPFWIKPVVSFASSLGFYIEDREEFDRRIETIRNKIHRYAEPMNYVLNQKGVSEAYREINGYYCIAEKIIKGSQCTVEGYVQNGKMGYTRVFDSHRYPDHNTFFSYEYPSIINEKTTERMRAITEKVMQHIGYDDSAFNVEYFYNKEEDHLWLLEINTRISQSHAALFNRVDGAPNHKAMVEVALGIEPDFPHRKGEYKVAGKFYYRVFEDGVVSRVPSVDELNKIKEEIESVEPVIWAKEGTQLSEMYDQDGYSYKLASIYLAAQSREELYEKRKRCFDMLNFEIEPVHSYGFTV